MTQLNSAVQNDDASRIRTLNDALRTNWQGGEILLTPGVNALGPAVIGDLLMAIAQFDAFTVDNDPYNEHDCASVALGDITALFKIDYYDTTTSRHSDDPADPALTRRVMTVMLLEEY